MPQSILTHQFENGLTLIAEPMEWLESAAFNVLVPSGCARDPENLLGLSNFTCEMVQRGCGQRDSRKFVEDLEILGVDRGSSVSNAHSSYGGAMPADRIHDVLAIYADMLRRPHLPPDQLEEGRMICIQEIRALDDELGQRVMIELRRHQYPEPLGRSCQGTIETVAAISNDDIRRHFEATYQPDQTILAVAGNIEWPRLKDCVGELFGDWQPKPLAALQTTPAPRGQYHIEHESAQTHIGVSYSSAAYADPDYFYARGAVGVLSDGMSSRLFTEIREKRGLCYSVYASNHSLLKEGSVICYAGTSTDRAQQTLDVLIDQLRMLAEGIREDELDRLKVQVRSGLIMQQESSRARAAAIAGDWYHLGRVRTLEEISQIISGLTVEALNRYLAEHPPDDFCIVTLGQLPLEAPRAVS